ncbi:hypothetical protein C0J52_02556 [Blattella germanica]|nr:hypothetical protein C0J52_02556 [Blattella germanica]
MRGLLENQIFQVCLICTPSVSAVSFLSEVAVDFSVVWKKIAATLAKKMSLTVSSKHEERKQQMLEAMAMSGGSMEKPEKKERSSKTKDKSMRDKNVTEEEKEMRKERKLRGKRDRAEEAMLLAEQKRRKEEEKAAKLASHQNGEPGESHGREKHHYPRDKSPYPRERERSHDREGRDKHRRSSEGKRR